MVSQSLTTETWRPSRCEWNWDLEFSTPNPQISRDIWLPLDCLTSRGRKEEGRVGEWREGNREKSERENKWKGVEGMKGKG